VEVVALIVGIVSICLAFFAIWQANHHRDQSDKLNRDTTEKLARIEAFATSTKEDAFDELKKWSEFARTGGKALEEAEKATERELRKLKDELQTTTADQLNKVLETVESKLNTLGQPSFISEIRTQFENLKEEIAKTQEKGLAQIRRLEIERKFVPLWLSLSEEQRELLVKVAKGQKISHDDLETAGVAKPGDLAKFVWRLFKGGMPFQIAFSKPHGKFEVSSSPEFDEFLEHMARHEME